MNVSEQQQAAMDAAKAAEARHASPQTQSADEPAEQPQEQQATPPAPADPPAPTKLAGKYDTPEALLDGLNHARERAGLPRYNDAVGQAMLGDVESVEAEYRKMSTLMRQQPEQGQDGQDAPDPNNLTIDPESVEPADLDGFLSTKGLSGDELAQQYQTEGKLTDEQYEKLGLPKAVVNEFLAGQMARAQNEANNVQQVVNEAMQIAGGDEGFSKLSQWAAANIPKEELGDPQNPQPGTINARIKDPRQVKSVIYELQARQMQATGAAGRKPLVSDTRPASSPTGGFTSLPEFLKASEENSRNGGTDAALRKRIQATDIAALYAGRQ